MGEASQRPLHFLTKGRHLRKKIRPKVQFLSEFFQFGVFLLLLFFYSYGTRQLCYSADTFSKKKKKAVARS